MTTPPSTKPSFDEQTAQKLQKKLLRTAVLLKYYHIISSSYCISKGFLQLFTLLAQTFYHIFVCYYVQGCYGRLYIWFIDEIRNKYELL